MNSHVRPEHADRAEPAAIAAGWLSRLYGRGPNHPDSFGRAFGSPWTMPRRYR